MSDDDKLTRRKWPATDVIATFKPTRSQIDCLILDTGRDPRLEVDLYLDQVNECLARLYGLQVTFSLEVEWVYNREELQAYGTEAAGLFELQQFNRISQLAAEGVLK